MVLVLVDHVFLELLLDLILNERVLIDMVVGGLVLILERAVNLEGCDISVVSVHLFVLVTDVEVWVIAVNMISVINW